MDLSNCPASGYHSGLVPYMDGLGFDDMFFDCETLPEGSSHCCTLVTAQVPAMDHMDWEASSTDHLSESEAMTSIHDQVGEEIAPGQDTTRPGPISHSSLIPSTLSRNESSTRRAMMSSRGARNHLGSSRAHPNSPGRSRGSYGAGHYRMSLSPSQSDEQRTRNAISDRGRRYRGGRLQGGTIGWGYGAKGNSDESSADEAGQESEKEVEEGSVVEAGSSSVQSNGEGDGIAEIGSIPVEINDDSDIKSSEESKTGDDDDESDMSSLFNPPTSPSDEETRLVLWREAMQRRECIGTEHGDVTDEFWQAVLRLYPHVKPEERRFDLLNYTEFHISDTTPFVERMPRYRFIENVRFRTAVSDICTRLGIDAKSGNRRNILVLWRWNEFHNLKMRAMGDTRNIVEMGISSLVNPFNERQEVTNIRCSNFEECRKDFRVKLSDVLKDYPGVRNASGLLEDFEFCVQRFEKERIWYNKFRKHDGPPYRRDKHGRDFSAQPSRNSFDFMKDVMWKINDPTIWVAPLNWVAKGTFEEELERTDPTVIKETQAQTTSKRPSTGLPRAPYIGDDATTSQVIPTDRDLHELLNADDARSSDKPTENDLSHLQALHTVSMARKCRHCENELYFSDETSERTGFREAIEQHYRVCPLKGSTMVVASKPRAPEVSSTPTGGNLWTAMSKDDLVKEVRRLSLENQEQGDYYQSMAARETKNARRFQKQYEDLSRRVKSVDSSDKYKKRTLEKLIKGQEGEFLRAEKLFQRSRATIVDPQGSDRIKLADLEEQHHDKIEQLRTELQGWKEEVQRIDRTIESGREKATGGGPHYVGGSPRYSPSFSPGANTGRGGSQGKSGGSNRGRSSGTHHGSSPRLGGGLSNIGLIAQQITQKLRDAGAPPPGSEDSDSSSSDEDLGGKPDGGDSEQVRRLKKIIMKGIEREKAQKEKIEKILRVGSESRLKEELVFKYLSRFTTRGPGTETEDESSRDPIEAIPNLGPKFKNILRDVQLAITSLRQRIDDLELKLQGRKTPSEPPKTPSGPPASPTPLDGPIGPPPAITSDSETEGGKSGKEKSKSRPGSKDPPASKPASEVGSSGNKSSDGGAEPPPGGDKSPSPPPSSASLPPSGWKKYQYRHVYRGPEALDPFDPPVPLTDEEKKEMPRMNRPLPAEDWDESDYKWFLGHDYRYCEICGAYCRGIKGMMQHHKGDCGAQPPNFLNQSQRDTMRQEKTVNVRRKPRYAIVDVETMEPIAVDEGTGGKKDKAVKRKAPLSGDGTVATQPKKKKKKQEDDARSSDEEDTGKKQRKPRKSLVTRDGRSVRSQKKALEILSPTPSEVVAPRRSTRLASLEEDPLAGASPAKRKAPAASPEKRARKTAKVIIVKPEAPPRAPTASPKKKTK